MADVYTTSASVTYDTAAYDLMAYYALRPELYYDQVADVKPTKQSHRGASVTFTIQADLAAASTAINESVDVSAVGLTNSQVTLTLTEYGNAAITTAKLRGTSFIELDPVVANVIGFNAGISIDSVVRDTLDSGTNVDYSGRATSRATVNAGNTLAGNDWRKEVSKLRGSFVPTIGGAYCAFIHPDVSYDFRGATGGANWRDPHTYSSPQDIMTGEIGMFEGCRAIETPRAPLFSSAGSADPATDVYATLFLGRQSLCKAWSNAEGNGPQPRVVPGPVTDHLRRFQPMGWYWLGAYGVFRQQALRRVESASTIATNP
jgi:N4-gp56 family major capsid protein